MVAPAPVPVEPEQPAHAVQPANHHVHLHSTQKGVINGSCLVWVKTNVSDPNSDPYKIDHMDPDPYPDDSSVTTKIPEYENILC